MTSSPSKASLLNQVKSIIPQLSHSLHKGQAGRVGVVGGSRDYTGAPYYSSMASMRLGADMSHTICEPSAGDVIKTYSPDLIVHRILDQSKSNQQIRDGMKGVFERLHSVVIGPGLGRDQHMQDCARIAIKLAREADIYTVIDADGLWLLQNEPSIIIGHKKAVLTPNVAEFGRLCSAMKIDPKEGEEEEVLKKLTLALKGPTILQKGKEDLISNGSELLRCTETGGLKRCGGQGDILAGCLGTFLAWATISKSGTGKNLGNEQIEESRLPLIASYGAALVARNCSREGFERLSRSMLANDLLDQVGKAYEDLFGDPQASL